MHHTYMEKNIFFLIHTLYKKASMNKININCVLYF